MGTNWRVGDKIQGRWEIYKILQGGVGIVYVVYDHAFREPFAAKTFRDEIVALNPAVAEQFSREGLAWVQLDVHANVVQARMVEKIEGKPFLFLEYVSGGDMSSWIGTPRLTSDLPQVLRFAIQFCDGMNHVMSKNIRAHRDIKPRNCLITSDGALKITDFGLAMLSDDDTRPAGSRHGGSPSERVTSQAMGTCTHMAPEQFDNPDQVDTRADTYAFGVMLYQMIKGELPFIGHSWEELEHLHKTQPAPYLDRAPKPVAELVAGCLSKNPTSRPANFIQLRGKLEEIFKSLVGVPPPGPPRDAALTAGQWNNKGSSLDNLGRREEAILCYDAALRLDPNLVAAHLNKGIALFGAGRPSNALACYEKALQLESKSERLWTNKGVVLKSLGDIEQAIACYEKAIICNPRYPNAWVNKGVALKAQGKNEEGLACYDYALSLNPGDVHTWTNKGNALFALKRYADALAAYDSALSLDSSLSLAWLNKGISLSALGRIEEALQCYGTAIETGPQLAQAWFLRGATLVNSFQEYREAIPYLEEAERLGIKEAKDVLAICRALVVTV
jgi:tetratricopeptide (TPR) repeat protein